VIGYTDNMPVGAPLQGVGIADNTQLSLKRASEAVAFFQSQGVNPSLLDAPGFRSAVQTLQGRPPHPVMERRRSFASLALPAAAELHRRLARSEEI
jgi:hypothetical protein